MTYFLRKAICYNSLIKMGKIYPRWWCHRVLGKMGYLRGHTLSSCSNRRMEACTQGFRTWMWRSAFNKTVTMNLIKWGGSKTMSGNLMNRDRTLIPYLTPHKMKTLKRNSGVRYNTQRIPPIKTPVPSSLSNSILRSNSKKTLHSHAFPKMWLPRLGIGNKKIREDP